MFLGQVYKKDTRDGALGLHHEHSADSGALALKEYGLTFQPAASTVALVEEHVAVPRLPSGDLAGPRDLEPLRCRFVGSNLWHLSSPQVFVASG